MEVREITKYIYGTSYIRSRKLSWARYVVRSDETRAGRRPPGRPR